MRTRNMWKWESVEDGGYAMDHDLSVRTKAAERYLLGELPAEEREAFEEHFFECAECAEQVRLGREFADNAAAVFAEESLPVTAPIRKQARRDWLAWLRPLNLAQAAAGVAVLAVIGYQNAIVIPQLRSAATSATAAEVVPSAVLVPSARGASRTISIPPGVRFFHLALDLGPVPTVEQYACDLRSASGKSILRVPVDSVDPVAGLHLVVPANGFSSGTYDAVLLGTSGGTATELAHYRFDVRRP